MCAIEYNCKLVYPFHVLVLHFLQCEERAWYVQYVLCHCFMTTVREFLNFMQTEPTSVFQSLAEFKACKKKKKDLVPMLLQSGGVLDLTL